MNTLPTALIIGRRIQLAREECGLSQADLASRLAIASHQSISELEKGNRRLQPQELVKLAEVLDKDTDYFVDPFSLVGEAQYSWRRSRGTEDGTEFEARADRLVGLLRWLRLQDEEALEPLKSTLRLSECSTFDDAERTGERLADTLKLGPVPADRLLEKVQSELDVPVLYVDMNDRSISGATVHLGDFSCILINRAESLGRRNFDLAHEVFHALTWDAMRPELFEINTLGEHGTGKKARIEQLADKFASALLMPRKLLEVKFRRAESGNVEQLRALATYFGVSTPALAFRLLALQWIDRRTCDELKAKPAEEASKEPPKLFSARFAELLALAFHDGRLSPRKAAKLLGLNLASLDAMLEQWGTPHAR